MVIKRCAVPDFSIAEAKSQFAHLVNQAELGNAVRITRRGRPVAVLMSKAEYERLSAPREGLSAFTVALRSQAAAAGIRLFDDAELGSLRDQSERPVPDLT
jgi:prevent-host-death family protein